MSSGIETIVIAIGHQGIRRHRRRAIPAVTMNNLRHRLTLEVVGKAQPVKRVSSHNLRDRVLCAHVVAQEKQVLRLRIYTGTPSEINGKVEGCTVPMSVVEGACDLLR